MSSTQPGAAYDEERLKALFESYVNPSGGRSLKELLECDDKLLKGSEAQRLRGHASSYSLHPVDCEDPIFVADLMTGRVSALKQRWSEQVRARGGSKDQVRKIWEDYRDSPNKLPLIDILQVGAWTALNQLTTIPKNVPQRYFDCLNFLVDQVGMSIEGTDVAGYTALQHSLTCTPLLYDLKWSEVLLAASADPIAAINHRNRYGTTSMHECVMSLMRPGETETRAKVLNFLLQHGANPDIEDGDKCSPRSTGGRIPMFKQLIEEFEKKAVRDQACAFCRRGGLSGKGKGKEEGSTATTAAAAGVVNTTDAKTTTDEKKEESIKDEETVIPVTQQKHSKTTSGALRANLRCGRCRSRNYCSASCQKMDWSAHKKKCVAINPTPVPTTIGEKA